MGDDYPNCHGGHTKPYVWKSREWCTHANTMLLYGKTWMSSDWEWSHSEPHQVGDVGDSGHKLCT